jgi:hypothetical protein
MPILLGEPIRTHVTPTTAGETSLSLSVVAKSRRVSGSGSQSSTTSTKG